MMKLEITYKFQIEVTDLADYNATTLEEAAVNQTKLFNSGDADPLGVLTSALEGELEVIVKPVKN